MPTLTLEDALRLVEQHAQAVEVLTRSILASAGPVDLARLSRAQRHLAQGSILLALVLAEREEPTSAAMIVPSTPAL